MSRRNLPRRVSIAFTSAVIASLVGGCSGDDGLWNGSEHGGDGEHDGTGTAFGEPADAADAARTIEIDAGDDLRFTPSTIVVSAGEVVTFEVTNSGRAVHDFTIGDEGAQQEHGARMEQAPGGGMAHDEPNSISIGAGATDELTWRFSGAGEVLVGCHQPGHYAGGMRARITVDD